MSRPSPDELKASAASLPDRPGVYLFKDARGTLLYIGKAVSIRKRVLSHFRGRGEGFSKAGHLLAEARSIDCVLTATEADALLLEASLVKEHQPKYNQELKDDKSFPFLRITEEEYPRLLVVRGRQAGGRYYGPYTNVKLLRQAVSMLRRLFPLRTCQPMPAKFCLMYHIQQCRGPCEGAVSRAEYLETVRELELFLQGRREALLKSLMRRMKEFSARREYEKAKATYEAVRALSSVPQPRMIRTGEAEVLDQLKQALDLPRPPRRIEGFDISNIQGKEAVGSLVVFADGRPRRAEYRHFRIKTVEGIDDYEMMREVVRRRFTRALADRQALPDLVVIDGGRGHLTAARSELEQLNLSDLPVAALAKQHEHLFVPERPAPHILPSHSPALQLLRHLRDEAHRFAIQYHRRLHRKASLLSVLDGIPGIGPKTKHHLLVKFGSAARIGKCSLEQLSAVKGMSVEKAKALQDRLGAPR